MTEKESNISLKDLYIESLKSKKTVFTFLVIFSILSIFSFIFSKDNWRGYIKIYPLTSIDYEDYLQISFFENEFKTNPDYLRNLLIEEMLDRSEVRQIVEQMKIIDKSKFEDEDDYYIALEKHIYTFKISDKIKNDQENEFIDEESTFNFTNRDYYTLEYTSPKKNDIDKVFNFVLNESNDNVREYLTKKLENYVSNYSKLISYKKDDVIEIYERRTDKNLAFLEEQAQIARSMDIKNNTIFAQDNYSQNSKTSITTIEREQPYYYRGYVAIEKEIELIKSRKDKSLFVEEQRDNASIFINDKTPDRIKKAFLISPINNEQFIAAKYNIGEIEYEKIGISKFLLSIIILVIGMLFLFFLILIRAVLSTFKKV